MRKKKVMLKNGKLAQSLKQAIELGLKILKEPRKVNAYLTVEEEKVCDDELEEQFVEGLLSETVVDGGGVGKSEGEVIQEEMFVDSFLEQIVNCQTTLAWSELLSVKEKV